MKPMIKGLLIGAALAVPAVIAIEHGLVLEGLVYVMACIVVLGEFA